MALFLSMDNVAQILSEYSGKEDGGLTPIHSRRTWPIKPSSQICSYSSFSSSEIEAVLSGGKEEELFKSPLGRANKSQSSVVLHMFQPQWDKPHSATHPGHGRQLFLNLSPRV